MDFDATDSRLHGQQQGRFYHGYYEGYCYLPLLAFIGEVPVWTELRTADGDELGRTRTRMQRTQSDEAGRSGFEHRTHRRRECGRLGRNEQTQHRRALEQQQKQRARKIEQVQAEVKGKGENHNETPQFLPYH